MERFSPGDLLAYVPPEWPVPPPGYLKRLDVVFVLHVEHHPTEDGLTVISTRDERIYMFYSRVGHLEKIGSLT